MGKLYSRVSESRNEFPSSSLVVVSVSQENTILESMLQNAFVHLVLPYANITHTISSSIYSFYLISKYHLFSISYWISAWQNSHTQAQSHTKAGNVFLWTFCTFCLPGFRTQVWSCPSHPHVSSWNKRNQWRIRRKPFYFPLNRFVRSRWTVCNWCSLSLFTTYLPFPFTWEWGLLYTLSSWFTGNIISCHNFKVFLGKSSKLKLEFTFCWSVWREVSLENLEVFSFNADSFLSRLFPTIDYARTSG